MKTRVLLPLGLVSLVLAVTPRLWAQVCQSDADCAEGQNCVDETCADSSTSTEQPADADPPPPDEPEPSTTEPPSASTT